MVADDVKSRVEWLLNGFLQVSEWWELIREIVCTFPTAETRHPTVPPLFPPKGFKSLFMDIFSDNEKSVLSFNIWEQIFFLTSTHYSPSMLIG